MVVHVGGRGPGHLARMPGTGGVDRSAYLDFQFGWPRSAYWLDGGLYDSFGSVPGATSTGGGGFGQALRNGSWSGNLPDGTPLIGDGGLGGWEARTNLFLNSATPVTQNITLSATGNYTITCFDAGSVVVAAGTATITGAGTATPGSPVTINCTATGTISCTVSGSPYCVNVTAGANVNGPPIFTAGAPATRTAVAQSVSGLVLPSGDFDIEQVFKTGPIGAQSRPLEYHNGTDNERIIVLYQASGILAANLVIGGVATIIATTPSTIPALTEVKVELQRRGSNWRFAVNEAQVGADTAAGVPTVNTVILGQRRNFTEALNSTISHHVVRRA